MQVNNTLLHTAAILEEAADLEISNTGAKVAIVPVGQENPEGYQALELISERANVDQFADNECVEIVANVLDFLSYENINQFVLSLLSKLRKGGKLTIGGTDFGLFSKEMGSNHDVETFNRLAYTRKSMTSMKVTKDYLESLGLTTVRTIYNGLQYEITATRR